MHTADTHQCLDNSSPLKCCADISVEATKEQDHADPQTFNYRLFS